MVFHIQLFQVPGWGLEGSGVGKRAGRNITNIGYWSLSSPYIDSGDGVGNVQDAVSMVETLSQLEKSGVKMPGNFENRY